MPNVGEELSTIDFENVIGGPLVAVVHAQAQSAFATVDFIKTVGFDSEGKVVNVEFKYEKTPPGGTTATTATLDVPLLTIVPIPFLRVEEVNIEFLAKINSVEYQETTTKDTISADLTVNQRWPLGSAKLKVSYSHERQSRSGATVTREYSMTVKVKAVQDEMPAGMEKVMGILESLIAEKPSS